MNRILHLVLPMLFCVFTAYSQEDVGIKCTMTVEEILEVQPFDIDHATAEFAREVAEKLLSELSVIYNKITANDLSDIAQNTETINGLVAKAKELEMNYSMFEEDLEFLETIE